MAADLQKEQIGWWEEGGLWVYLAKTVETLAVT